jgi:O-antigen/teichoic acid export membrane protein
VIGKCFKATELGLYSRAKTFPYFASVNLASIFQRALFPILCEVKHDQDRLVHIYREYLKLSIAIISPLVLGICALSKPLILSLLSDKWIDAVPVLHILCFSYLFSPIVMLNNNVYQVTGNTALFLKLEFIKKIIGVSFLVVSLPFGLYGVLIGSVLSALISLIYNMHFTSTMIPLTIRMQVYDILPIFILSAIMAVIVYVSILFIPIYWVQIIGGILVGGFSYSILLKLVIPCTFMNIKEIILKTIRK